MKNISRPILFGALAGALAACSGESPTATAPPTHPATITIVPDNGHAASIATLNVHRTWPVIANRRVSSVAGAFVGPSARVSPSATSFAATINSPYDLSFVGGPVITGGTNWNLYLNCDSSSTDCWGSNGLGPADFMKDLNNSRIISVLDQYIGVRAARRFGLDSLGITDPNIAANNNVLTRNEIFNILFSVVLSTGRSGYTNIYHLYVPQGTDVCVTPSACYSPDNFSTFAFCAFHGAVTFNGGIHVIYSVEPYQDVPGCQNPNGLPHGSIDATASTVSHEFFESVSDPDLNAWYNVITQGEEIADLCFVFEYDEQVALHHYQIQTEYSNAVHGCTDMAR